MYKRILLSLLASAVLTTLSGATHLTLYPDGTGNLKEVLLGADTDGLESLKIVGKLKSADWQYLASNSGAISWVKELDLSEAEISYDREVYSSVSEPTGSMGTLNMEEYYFWPVDSVAYRRTPDGTVWEYWGNNAAGAFKGTSYEKVVMPKKLSGLGRNAFKGCKNLKEVVLGGNEKYIGECAFYQAGELSKLDLPATVGSIGDKAFYESCNDLSLDMTHISAIGKSAFEGSGICEVVLPDGMKELPAECFYGCKQLRSAKFGRGMEIIGKSAFGGCNALETVTFSEGLKRIGDYAFVSCDLSDCSLPESIEEIGAEAFRNCSNLKSVSVPTGVTTLGHNALDGTPFEKSLQAENGIKYIGHIAYIPAPEMPADVIIKEGTKVLADELFYYNRLNNGEWSHERLKSIKLPSTLTHIGDGVFNSCKLQNISLPEGLVKIGNSCFADVELESITLPSTLKIIGDEAFYISSASNEAKLHEIILPYDLEEIGSYAFAAHPLKSVSLPANIKVLGAGAFGYNKSLVSIDYNCREAVLTSSLHNGSNSPFDGSSCDRLTFGNSVESIPAHLCDGLNLNAISIVFPEGLKSIGNRAFSQCYSIKNVSFPFSLERIDDYAFYNASIEELTLPENVVFIGDNAFGDIKSLKTLNFNCRNAVSNDTIVETQFGPVRQLGKPFEDSTCNELSIGKNVKSIMPYFMTGNEKSFKFIDLSQIESIGEGAFSESLLENAVLPENMEEIPEGLFRGCYELLSVRMPVSCKRIGDDAFRECYKLKPNEFLPEGLEEIGNFAFLRCQGMSDFDSDLNRWKSLVLPPTIKRVDNGAFAGCTGVNSVFIPSTIEYLGESSLNLVNDEFGTIKKVIMMRPTPFDGSKNPFNKSYDAVQAKWTAVVPEGSKKLYASQSGWSSMNIEEMGSFITDTENVFVVNFGDLVASGEGLERKYMDTEGRIVGGVYYSMPNPTVEEWSGEQYPVLSMWDGCSEENAQKLHGARIDTHYIYDFFTGFGVMLPAVKGSIELDANLCNRQMNILIDGYETTSVTGDDERSKRYIDFDLSEPALAWFYLSEADRGAARIFKLAIHPNQDASGVENINADLSAEVTERYDISGRRVAGDRRGVILERLSDGSVRKVIR